MQFELAGPLPNAIDGGFFTAFGLSMSLKISRDGFGERRA